MGCFSIGAKKFNKCSVSIDCVASSLNCLPDDLLVHILSSLPTKQAASTSILSKRWRTLFTFVHDFDFDDSIFWHPEGGKRYRRDIQESFRSFVGTTLAFQGGAPTNKFSLKCENEHDKVHVDGWICNALARGVSELHLSLKYKLSYDFPCQIFTSTTLVKLSLGSKHYIQDFPPDISLPALKVLFLDSIWFKGNQLSKVFLPACPVLEHLNVNHKYFMPYIISSKTIKKLSITYEECADYDDFYSTTALDIPNVVELYYSNYARRWAPRCRLGSLEKATLDLHYLEGEEKLDADVTALINGIRNVKTLHLTSYAIEVISECCKGKLPVFNNLIDLVLLGNKEQGWEVILPLLLKNSPNLTNLVLSRLCCCTYRHSRIRIPPDSQIKMMSIMQYQGSACELERIGHFFLKMNGLEVMKVSVSPAINKPKKMKLIKYLLKLPKSSPKLKIQVM